MKGRLWIEGYEGHMNTGQDLDVFLKQEQLLSLQEPASLRADPYKIRYVIVV